MLLSVSSNYAHITVFHLLEHVLLTSFLLFGKFFPFSTIRRAHTLYMLLYGSKSSSFIKDSCTRTDR